MKKVFEYIKWFLSPFLFLIIIIVMITNGTCYNQTEPERSEVEPVELTESSKEVEECGNDCCRASYYCKERCDEAYAYNSRYSELYKTCDNDCHIYSKICEIVCWLPREKIIVCNNKCYADRANCEKQCANKKECTSLWTYTCQTNYTLCRKYCKLLNPQE